MIKKISAILLSIFMILSFVPTVSAQAPQVSARFESDTVTVGEKNSVILSVKGEGINKVEAFVDIDVKLKCNTKKMGFDTKKLKYTISFNPSEADFSIECTALSKGEASFTFSDITYYTENEKVNVGNITAKTEILPVYKEIYTKEDLYNIRNDLSGDYMLMNDIVFTNADFEQGGAFYGDGFGWRPIGAVASNSFKGSLNGAGHSIVGLKITKAYYNYCGLFGVSEGEIRNLRLKDAAIDGIYGINTTVLADGSNVNDKETSTGLAVDYNDKDVWTESDSSVTEESLNRYDRTGISNATVGGICGYSMGTVRDCFVSGSIKGSNSTGGIVGRNTGKISGCAVNANISGDNVAGGITALCGSKALINDCVTQGEITGGIAGCIIGEAKGTVSCVYTLCNKPLGKLFGSGSPESSEVYAPDINELSKLVFTSENWVYGGSIPYPKALADLVPDKEEELQGDINADLSVDVNDLADLKIALALGTISELENGDVDKDGEINVSDLAMLKLILAGA